MHDIYVFIPYDSKLCEIKRKRSDASSYKVFYATIGQKDTDRTITKYAKIQFRGIKRFTSTRRSDKRKALLILAKDT